MKTTLRAAELAVRLELERLNPGFDDPGVIEGSAVGYAGLALAGWLSKTLPGRCVLLGESELGYLAGLAPAEAEPRIDGLLGLGLGCLLVAREVAVPETLLTRATLRGVGVYRSKLTDRALQPVLAELLRDWLAPRETTHGVMVDVFGVGVLLMGESGIGKSECALELVKRGHRLVADDGVVLKRLTDDTVVASSQPGWRHAMEIRGIGLIDVRALFGMGAIGKPTRVSLAIRFEKLRPDAAYERLGLDTVTSPVFGVPVPTLVIPVIEGKNLSILVEVAAMNQHLKSLGLDPAREMTEALAKRLVAKTAPPA